MNHICPPLALFRLQPLYCILAITWIALFISASHGQDWGRFSALFCDEFKVLHKTVDNTPMLSIYQPDGGHGIPWSAPWRRSHPPLCTAISLTSSSSSPAPASGPPNAPAGSAYALAC